MRTRDTYKEGLVKSTAVSLLTRDGFEGFSMNKLAKACGISVATLYIYYKDKDDLIIQIASEKLSEMNDMVLRDFDPALSFAEGLRVQWKNRAAHLQGDPVTGLFFEQLRNSTYREKVFNENMSPFKAAMTQFMNNAVEHGEIDAMPLEVFWSVAYGPLYTLLRFSTEGRSLAGKKFTMNEEILWQTFDLVLKALLKK